MEIPWMHITLYKLLIVDPKLEGKSQLIGSFSAQQHPSHKDLKEIHNGAELGVYRDVQHQSIFFYFQIRPCDRVIYPVVDVEGNGLFISDS